MSIKINVSWLRSHVSLFRFTVKSIRTFETKPKLKNKTGWFIRQESCNLKTDTQIIIDKVGKSEH